MSRVRSVAEDVPASAEPSVAVAARAGEWIVAAFLAAVVALVFQQVATDMAAQNIASGGPYDNAAVYPRTLAIVVAALLAVRVASLGIAARRTGASAASVARTGPLRAGVLLGAFALYLAALGTLGYAVATPVFALAVLMLCGERRPVRALGFAIGTAAVLSLVFESLLSVVLPRGWWDIGFPW